MKKLLTMLLCLLISLSIVACKKEKTQQSVDNNKEASSTENITTNNQENLPQNTEGSLFSKYKDAYLAFLTDKKESHYLFALVFIDNDDIPELYLRGISEAGGDMICSFKNDTVIYQYLSRTGGGKYIERSGNIANQNGHMGLYYTNVYKLDTNGFTKTFNAKYTERYEHIGNEEYNVCREYFIDNISVSEVDYNNAIRSAFDFSKAINLDKDAVSYEEIIQQLKNDNS